MTGLKLLLYIKFNYLLNTFIKYEQHVYTENIFMFTYITLLSMYRGK